MRTASTATGGAALLFARRDRPHKKTRRIVVRRRYGLYYALNFLQGCRKQMFITFAIFALVKIHGMPVHVTMWLVLIKRANGFFLQDFFQFQKILVYRRYGIIIHVIVNYIEFQ